MRGKLFLKKKSPPRPLPKNFVLYIRGLGFVFLDFARETFLKKSLPRAPFQKLLYYIARVWTVQIGRRKIQPFHVPPKLYPAIAPNRRRMTPSAAPERSPADLDGTRLVRNRTCTNYIHPHPHIKVLLELERTSSFSKATVPLVPLVSPVPLVPLKG